MGFGRGCGERCPLSVCIKGHRCVSAFVSVSVSVCVRVCVSGVSVSVIGLCVFLCLSCLCLCLCLCLCARACHPCCKKEENTYHLKKLLSLSRSLSLPHVTSHQTASTRNNDETPRPPTALRTPPPDARASLGRAGGTVLSCGAEGVGGGKGPHGRRRLEPPFWKHLSLSLDVFVTLSLELHILGLFSCILDLFYLSS